MVSDNGLSPSRRQAIIWTDVGILLIEPLVINLREISTEIYAVSIQENTFKYIWKYLLQHGVYFVSASMSQMVSGRKETPQDFNYLFHRNVNINIFMFP